MQSALKQANDELLEHARRRKVEAMIFEVQEEMAEKGYSDADIEARVSASGRSIVNRTLDRSRHSGPASCMFEACGTTHQSHIAMLILKHG